MKQISWLAICASSILASTALAQDSFPSPSGAEEAQEWYELDKKKGEAAAAGTVSYFHEGHGCSQDWWGISNGFDYKNVSPNDEFKSVDLRGPAGTAVTVYDARGFAQTDDFAAIVKTDDDPVCVWNFEEDSPGEWINYRGYRIWYSGGNGLDGKVSSVRWGKWW